MDGRNLTRYRNWLYRDLPLVGGFIKKWAAKSVAGAAVRGDDGAIRLLVELIGRLANPELRFLAYQALLTAARSGVASARDALCDLVIDHDDERAREAVTGAGYLPGNEVRRAMFFLLTEQWGRYEDLDFTHRLLRRGYWSAGDTVRQRLLDRLRAHGAVDWMRAVLVEGINVDEATVHGEVRQLADMNEDEWEVAIQVLSSQARWSEMVRLAEVAPLRWGAAIVRVLVRQREPQVLGREGLRELGRLAEDWGEDGYRQPHTLVLGKRVWERKRDTPAWKVAFSPDGRSLAAGGDDKLVQLLRTLDGDHVWSGMHDQSVWDVAFSPDGQYVVSGSLDRTVRLWRVADGECLWSRRHDDALIRTVFSRDGQFVASGSWDRTVRVWRIPDGECFWVRRHDNVVWGVAFSPDSRFWASGSWDRTARIWRMTDGRSPWIGNHDHSVWDVAFSPDSRFLASASADKTLRLWRVEDGECVWVGKHDGEVRGVVFSPDGRFLASAGLDGAVRLWRVADGECSWAGRHEGEVRNVVFSPDGRFLVSGGLDRTLRLWQVTDGKCVWERRHKYGLPSFVFSPAGDLFASVSWDNAVRLWQFSPWPEVPLAEVDDEDARWLKERLDSGDLDPRQQAGLRLFMELLNLRQRWDIQVEDAQERISVGEFDIEIEESGV